MMTEAAASLPYHEPGIITILIQASLLICLNLVNSVLDKVLYCGLIGQILLGIAWGTPGAKWLAPGVEQTIVQLGYLGLLLLVYEGGLSTSVRSLKANLWLSVGVATTGIALPIVLSFVLRRLTQATLLQCFAAGASLSSTSLGTTFTVLGTSGLTSSRLGVVLTSAAMMDDVIGLVLVQVISSFGHGSGSLTAPIVVRPLLVSAAFAVAAPCVCLFIVKPATRWLRNWRAGNKSVDKALRSERAALAIHILVLIGCISAASYAGTSNLFAAYLSGACISWWDAHVQQLEMGNVREAVLPAALSSVDRSGRHGRGDEPSANQPETPRMGSSSDALGLHIYRKFFLPPVTRVLKPYFFASIGFSIPVGQMFSGEIVWKGLTYAALMCFAKLACGSWLLRFSVQPFVFDAETRRLCREKIKSGLSHFWTHGAPSGRGTAIRDSSSHPDATKTVSTKTSRRDAQAQLQQQQGQDVPQDAGSNNHLDNRKKPKATKPRSVYPASIIACAMVARGEIGFLISSIAEGNGVFSQNSDNSMASDLFLIVTWAIVICTIVGPLSVGILVQRIKRLQKGVREEGRTESRNVLGDWGLS